MEITRDVLKTNIKRFQQQRAESLALIHRHQVAVAECDGGIKALEAALETLDTEPEEGTDG
jgi:hypothetical protein